MATHTKNGYDPLWVKAINHVLADREVDLTIDDIDEEIWDRFLGPMVDYIEDTHAKTRWWTESLGRIKLKVPVEAIADCSHQRQCETDVAYWVDKIDWTDVSREDLEASLKEFGAWEDLKTAELSTLKQRLLWCACCDLNES